MAKTWKELEAEGVQRCCAMFTSGRRCRRRATPQASWCDKHGGVIKAYEDQFKRIEEQMRRAGAK